MSKVPRYLERYRGEIAPALKDELGLSSVMEVPRLEKIIVNMGLGNVREDPKVLETALKELSQITGQKAVATRSKKSISSFKIREGWVVGAMVTLRRWRMYDFLDRFINIAVPRVRDFRGFSLKSFDGRGNYSIGVREQVIFPEIKYDEVDRVRGMDIAIVTTAGSDQHCLALLKAFGMPFRERG
ncbi:MAG: 50S ribosomal protein L5 [bacterium]